MVRDETEQERKMAEFYSTLFGFQKGSRVKKLTRTWSWFSTDVRYYWRYGLVTKSVDENFVTVRWDGNQYRTVEKITDLRLCRKYVKRE